MEENSKEALIKSVKDLLIDFSEKKYEKVFVIAFNECGAMSHCTSLGIEICELLGVIEFIKNRILLEPLIKNINESLGNFHERLNQLEDLNK